MYQGFRNKVRSHNTVRQAYLGGGMSERAIKSAKYEHEGRVLKIFTKHYDENLTYVNSLLTLVQQPGHEPRAFVQRTASVGHGWPEKRRPTGDFVQLDPSEALSLVFRSEYNYLDLAGMSAVKQVIEFFPVALNPELPQ